MNISEQRAALIQSLTARAYVEPGIYDAEQELIFASTWQYACHVEKLSRPGDYVVCELAKESIIVIRDDHATINAFYNVCPHRASRLLEAEGCRKRFACPYHAWTFNTRGELVSAPNAQNVAGFNASNYALRTCRVEIMHGLVFVNLDDDARPLQQLAPELLADLGAYVLVAHERFPARHAWLVSRTLSEAAGAAKTSGEFSWHPGADLFLKGEPEPRT